MTETGNAGIPASAHEDTPLAVLTKHLRGHWRVTGPGIEGQAEYDGARDGTLLVGTVQVVIDQVPMTNIQHIAHDEATDTLRARYLDSFGDEATYVWELDGRRIRVSDDASGSGAYFEASFNDDFSASTGRWRFSPKHRCGRRRRVDHVPADASGRAVAIRKLSAGFDDRGAARKAPG